MSRRGRESHFWEAAFHSNARFSEMWDNEFGDYITAEDLEIIRGVHFNILFDDSPANNTVRDRFVEFFGGVSPETAAFILKNEWNNFINGENDDLLMIDWLVAMHREFAEENNINPEPSVHDFVILSHVYRYR